MTTPNDIQGNSWTDEPEIPNTKREYPQQPPKKPEPEKPAEPASEQRPPGNS